MTQENTKTKVDIVFNIVISQVLWHEQTMYTAELPEYDIPLAIGKTADDAMNAEISILFGYAKHMPLLYPLQDEQESLARAKFAAPGSKVHRYVRPFDVDTSLLSMTEESMKLLARNIVLLDGGQDVSPDDLEVVRHLICYAVSRKDKEPLFDDYTAIHIFGDTFMCISRRRTYDDRTAYYIGDGFVDRLARRIWGSRHVQGSDIPSWATDLARSYIREKRKRLLAKVQQLPNEDDWLRLPEDMLQFLRKHADTLYKESFGEQPKGEDDE